MTLNILVTGSSSGLGLAIAQALRFDGHLVYEYDKISNGEPDYVEKPAAWLQTLKRIDVLINCAGVNMGEWFESVKLEDLEEVMRVNAFGPVLMTQALLPQLATSKGIVINIVSNAATIPMTASLAYNMSKAALLMATKQMAHELTKHYGITVFSVSPNKLKGTAMSRQIEERTKELRSWSAEYAEQYQKSALMHGEETPPELVARTIADLLESGSAHYLSGCDIAFGK